MKKLFTLFTALLVVCIASAETHYINNSTADALRVALGSANDGDVIVMEAGTYVESNSNYIAFANKHVTVKAADGAEVLIQPQVPITISGGGCAHFVGVKFDVSRLLEKATWYEHLMYPSDDNASNSIILNGCELYNFNMNKSLLYCATSNTLASISINNCYFHNIVKSCLFIENTGAINISITNSTFANITTDAGSYSAGVIDSRATEGSFLVDHCTFYDVQVMNTDYAAIGKVKLPSGAVVSNCIFAFSESASDNYRAIRDAVTANNCLVYNYTADSGYGMQGGVTKNNCFIADPLFTDAANGDFSYAGNWSTGEVSPARGAGTDGSDLGAPRWYTSEVIPSTDFSTPYILSNLSPKISGNISYDSEGKEIIYNGAQNAGTATWKVHATRACCVSVSFHNGLASSHHLSIEIRDKENNVVGSPLEDVDRYSEGDYAISGSLCFPEAGDYTIILSNTYPYTGAHISNLALTLVSEEVTIGSTGWATYCSDNALNFFGSDVEAYIVTGHSGNMLEKTRLNSTIPANTPLLLKADAGSYNIPKVSSSETSTTGNKLVRGTGSGVGYEEGKTRYVLMANGSTAEFQLLANGGALATVGTNKAYLEFDEVISLAPSALRLENEENNATSIEEVNSSNDAFKFVENGKLFIKKNGVVYDMMGRVIR